MTECTIDVCCVHSCVLDLFPFDFPLFNVGKSVDCGRSCFEYFERVSYKSFYLRSPFVMNDLGHFVDNKTTGSTVNALVKELVHGFGQQVVDFYFQSHVH